MIKKRLTKDVDTIHMMPGDTLVLHESMDGVDRELLRDTVERAIKVNRVVTFDIKNELGIKDGIGGIFGEKETP